MRHENWAEINYERGVEKQLALVQQISEGNTEDTLVFCWHSPVVTLGRGVKSGDVFSWSGDLIESSRGGRATYHGPNQQVIYPIIDLSRSDRKHLKPKDLHSYLRLLENVVVETLKSFGVQGYIKTEPMFDSEGNKLETTGVWVGERKISSIGIAVKKWVAYHGIAINLFNDPTAFQGIKPCGFSISTMTSIEEELRLPIERENFITQFAKCFREQMPY